MPGEGFYMNCMRNGLIFIFIIFLNIAGNSMKTV